MDKDDRELQLANGGKYASVTTPMAAKLLNAM